jgi:hypothetical protein
MVLNAGRVRASWGSWKGAAPGYSAHRGGAAVIIQNRKGLIDGDPSPSFVIWM